jgi:hypothetical protein
MCFSSVVVGWGAPTADARNMGDALGGPPGSVLRFGNFELDAQAAELARSGTAVSDEALTSELRDLRRALHDKQLLGSLDAVSRASLGPALEGALAIGEAGRRIPRRGPPHDTEHACFARIVVRDAGRETPARIAHPLR